MSSVAYLFPGQGSQYPGMAAGLYEQYGAARDLIDEADRILGFSLSEIMFGEVHGDVDERLKQTEITQPALYVHSMATLAVLRGGGHRPAMAAGHSLGEYSALTAAGALDFADGLRVVRRRGELMARAGEERPGAMAAVLGMDDAAVEHVCKEASDAPESVVTPANFNAPGQVVISGDLDAVERAMDGAREAGAKRVIALPVSGAFHSPLMAYARGGLEAALSTLHISEPAIPVYLNVTAEPCFDPELIRQRLAEQLTAPVLWSQTMRAMREAGAGRFLEVGAGNVLSGLARRTLGRDVETATADSAADLSSLLATA